MENLFERIKAFLSNPNSIKDSQNTAPVGMCPTCWGHNEWEGKLYEIIRDKHLTPGNEKYNSFISEIVDKHVATTHKHGNKYICTTCNKDIA